MGRHNEGVLHKFLTTEAERIIAHSDTPVWVHPHRNISRIPKTIVCALDFSENCKRAAEAAVVVAKKCESKLHFIHVIPESSGYVDMEGQLNIYYPQEEAEREQIHHNIANVMNELIQGLNLVDVDYEQKILFGGAADAVSRFCDELDAELLVIGSSSHTTFEKIFMGSTMRWLLNSFKQDILVIP